MRNKRLPAEMAKRIMRITTSRGMKYLGKDKHKVSSFAEVEKEVGKHREVMRQILENLRGDAPNVALEIGTHELCGANIVAGSHVELHLPGFRHEPKQLYKEGHVRQTGESMQSSILRQKHGRPV